MEEKGDSSEYHEVDVKELGDKAQAFWDGYFAKSESISDWFLEFSALEANLRRYMSPTDSILIVGCGKSALSAQIYDAGFHDVTSMDISEVAISEMIEKHKVSHPALKWCVGDVTNLHQFSSSTFDVVIDKATSDALQYRNSKKDGEVLLPKMFDEISRVLKPTDGRFLVISSRRKSGFLLDTKRFGWQVKTEHIGPASHATTLVFSDGEGAQINQGGRARETVFVHVCLKGMAAETAAKGFKKDIAQSRLDAVEGRKAFQLVRVNFIFPRSEFHPDPLSPASFLGVFSEKMGGEAEARATLLESGDRVDFGQEIFLVAQMIDKKWESCGRCLYTLTTEPPAQKSSKKSKIPQPEKVFVNALSTRATTDPDGAKWSFAEMNRVTQKRDVVGVHGYPGFHRDGSTCLFVKKIMILS